MKPDLSTSIAGLKLRNPVILASGILGLTAPMLRRVAASGVGAVVTKSIGLRPREGYKNPSVVELQVGLLNAMGLPNPGVDAFLDELSGIKGLGIPVIASIYGFSAQELVEVAGKFDVSPDIAALELNVSCPHVGSVHELGGEPKALRKVVQEVKAHVKKPVFVKLSPNVTNIVEVACVAVEAGADALTATNTVRAMAIDVEAGIPVLANKVGGLSGPAIKPIALRCVYEVSSAVKAPVIGCGGIENAYDALEFLMAGAAAVQVGTAVAHRGLGVFNKIVHGLEAYLERKGYKSLMEVVGLAHGR